MARDIFRGEGGDNLNLDDFPWQKISGFLPFLIIAVVGIVLIAKSAVTVQAHEKAVVLRFGKEKGILPPGLHFLIPFVDKPINVNTQEFSIRLPMGGAENDQTLMLTGDLSAAVVQWTIQFAVSDPAKYLFTMDHDPIPSRNVSHIGAVVEAISQSVMHQLVGDYSIDEMLTDRREEVRAEAQELTETQLARFGIAVRSLRLQRVTPPPRVNQAFDEVNASLQKKEELVNQAKRERNVMLPQALAGKDKLIQEANGYARRRRAEAEGEIAALLAKYEQYKLAPESTRQRLYLEAMEEVLSGDSPITIIDDELPSVLPMMQIGSDPPSGPFSPKGGVR